MSFDIHLINKLVEEFHNTQLEITERDLYNTPNPEDTLFALCLEDTIEQLQKNYHDNIFEKEEIKLIANKLNYKPNNEEIHEIGKILLNSKINHLKNINDNINKGYYNKAKPIFKKVVAEIETKKIHRTIESTFEKFKKYQSKIDKWTLDTTQLVDRAFNILNLYFKDKDLVDISFDDLIDFRDILLEIPNKLTIYNFFKNKDLDFILENNDDYEKLENSTINKYIIRINQYFKYMHKLKYITNDDFIIPKFDENLNKRVPYTNEEIELIKQLIKNDTLENQFITYIATYQGMRLKEITQLQKKDIIKIGDILCIDINTNEDKTTKTKKSARIIPIHNKLLELGFLDFVNLKDDKLFNISNKDFSTYFRKTYKNQINDEKTFYCLRHSFLDTLKQNDCKIEHYQSFVGHSQGKNSVTMDYGNPFNTKLLSGLLVFIDY
ncbi:tyrosine-type recombinase/integrase [Arcobacter defluvii]|nr:tyrosine-type recombinase/integrase [Arcobacter defluvii]